MAELRVNCSTTFGPSVGSWAIDRLIVVSILLCSISDLWIWDLFQTFCLYIVRPVWNLTLVLYSSLSHLLFTAIQQPSTITSLALFRLLSEAFASANITGLSWRPLNPPLTSLKPDAIFHTQFFAPFGMDNWLCLFSGWPSAPKRPCCRCSTLRDHLPLCTVKSKVSLFVSQAPPLMSDLSLGMQILWPLKITILVLIWFVPFWFNSCSIQKHFFFFW